MSILAKQTFVKSIERKLGYTLTVVQVQEVIKCLNTELSDYRLESLEDSDERDFSEVLTLFLDAKRIEGCSPKTIKHYRYVIGRMREFVKVPLGSITVFHLRSYLMHEKDRGIADRTIVGNRDVFCSFFGWAYKEGFITKNPTMNLSKIKFIKKFCSHLAMSR